MKRFACFCFVTVMLTGDTGTSVRPSASDYGARRTMREATIAANILPAAQVARLFSSAVGKKYTVVEIAVYPQGSAQNSGDSTLSRSISRGRPRRTTEFMR